VVITNLAKCLLAPERFAEQIHQPVCTLFAGGRCIETVSVTKVNAALFMASGLASSLTDAGPQLSRSTMTHRVGSASA
jgi:hypothetical protein